MKKRCSPEPNGASHDLSSLTQRTDVRPLHARRPPALRGLRKRPPDRPRQERRDARLASCRPDSGNLAPRRRRSTGGDSRPPDARGISPTTRRGIPRPTQSQLGPRASPGLPYLRPIRRCLEPDHRLVGKPHSACKQSPVVLHHRDCADRPQLRRLVGSCHRYDPPRASASQHSRQLDQSRMLGCPPHRTFHSARHAGAALQWPRTTRTPSQCGHDLLLRRHLLPVQAQRDQSGQTSHSLPGSGTLIAMTIPGGYLRGRSIARAAAPLVALSLATAVLLLFPPARFSFYPQCPIHEFLHLQCPGCGGTRALVALLHGHLAEAFHFNALVTLLVPIVIACGILCYSRFLQCTQPSLLPPPSQ